MRRRGLQIHRRTRLWLYSASLFLLASGVCWAWFNHLDQIGRANELLRQAKTWLIAVHGFSAVLFVLVLGTLLVGHVRRAWHAHKNRANGGFFLITVGLLVLSGYALYYIGNETWRGAVSNFHLWLGVASPALLYWHIRSGTEEVTRD